ncbi:MAG TPA: spore maturation protein [Bacteroidota bacterium]|nr:spore maturation protein [Bacteroidota bacterium]
MVELFRNILNIISVAAIPVMFFLFLGWGFVRKVKVYEVFVEGAKDGFHVAVKIIPFLVAMLLAIGIFRASGAMDVLIAILSPVSNLIGMPAETVPLALLRPLSGSGSLGLMTELMKVHGPDSFIGVLASTMYGSSETTFYVLAVYFGAVGVKNARHALPAGIIADIFGMLGALFICRVFFGI